MVCGDVDTLARRIMELTIPVLQEDDERMRYTGLDLNSTEFSDVSGKILTIRRLSIKCF